YGTEGRPPILEKESYVTWASRFLRFLDNKREEGELMRYSIDNGPLKRKLIDDPQHPGEKMYERVKYLSIEDMDRLMQGTYLSKQERHSRLMNEFDKFSVEIGESLTSVYERFSTPVNNVDRNKIKPSEIALNTKFLNDEVSFYTLFRVTSPILSARSYPNMDPQCSNHIQGSINAVIIHSEKQSDSYDEKAKKNKEEENDNPENIHVNPSTPPGLSVAFITKKVLKFNSFFESLGLVPQSSDTEVICTKGDNREVMFIELIRNNDDS
ncbi:hypothetical protein Tco_0753183, partial [Tanacetum coccineum]